MNAPKTYAQPLMSPILARFLWYELRDSSPEATVSARSLAHRLAKDSALSRKELVLLGFAAGKTTTTHNLE